MRGFADLSVTALDRIYASGQMGPRDLVAALYDRIGSGRPDWIFLRPRDGALAACATIEARRAAGEPLALYGVPFGVKDNIDVAGMPTTAACPSFSHVPARSARSVELLEQAGAICLGKTNLDQFATGLSGARSPYGACSSIGNPLYVSGGSSSGSAVVVAAGHVSFALGTDTGGSGRIPAGFNGVVGIKPTVGRVSTRGLVPNCPTLDCVSIFARTVDDGARVLDVIDGFDPDDPFARPVPARATVPQPARPFRFGVLAPADREWFGMRGVRLALRRGLRAAGRTRRNAGRDRLRAIARGGPHAVRRPVDRGAARRARAVRRQQARRASGRHAGSPGDGSPLRRRGGLRRRPSPRRSCGA